ncbi:hypothetical protein N3K66_008485 [Trichothecium roseum]|uniref:Uncharacterized protein n=1 Tax=Trichothecium roseum TaxID=47278 RepID=A0ACC0UQC6_9HYPO|nr:hypothetical protein N3K66_008485 [Trichothecium roseum]
MSDLRQACDRCHGKKLRCPKLPGSRVCTRCAKAGVPCVFSPPTRPAQPAHQMMSNYVVLPAAPTPAQQGLGDFGSDEAAMDWSSFVNFDRVPDASPLPPPPPPPPPQTRVECTQDCRFTSALLTAGLTPPEDTVSGSTSQHGSSAGNNSLTAQLSEMMITLDGLLAKMPGQGVRHMSTQQGHEWIALMRSKVDLEKVMEEVLQNTQRLVTVYPAVIEHVAREAEPEPDCAIPDCVHRAVAESYALPRVDAALLQLLLACHSRQLDVFGSVVEHGLMCGQMGAHIPREDRKLDVPEIRVGSFVAPRLTAASMLLSMVIELLMDMEGRSRDLSDLVTRSLGDRAGERELKQVKVFTLQCEVVLDRTADMVGQMRRFKEEMIKIGVIR